MLLFFLGVILIIMGFAIMFLPTALPKPGHEIEREDYRDEAKPPEFKCEAKGGAVIMIGPIPLVIGSDSKTALFLMILALVIMIFWFLISTLK